MTRAQRISGSNRMQSVENTFVGIAGMALIVGFVYVISRDVFHVFPVSYDVGVIIFFILAIACFLQIGSWFINEIFYDGNSHKKGGYHVEDWDNENF